MSVGLGYGTQMSFNIGWTGCEGPIQRDEPDNFLLSLRVPLSFDYSYVIWRYVSYADVACLQGCRIINAFS